MAEPQRLVVDTNVAFKWFVRERERNLPQARQLLEDFFRSQVGLFAPDVLDHELSNLLRRAVQQGRLATLPALQAHSDFLALGIIFVETASLIHDALRLGLALRISIFDALFLLVALRSNMPLVTDDERLATAGAAAGCAVIRLAEYQPVMG